jgi:serine/threonine-protein kinase
LPEVREQYRRLTALQGQIDELFPPNAVAEPDPLPAELPKIPGYEVESVLGRGGMGVVHKARHLRLNRLVALKMLIAGPFALPQERERFRREAEAVARLRHTNIVQVYDSGELDGRPFFTMEYIEGGTLSQKLDGTPLSARDAAALVATLADAVQAAHAGGIIHRDLKPANVLLTADGVPKVADFGLARALEGETALTQSGAAVGTPSYMAPEQYHGDTKVIGAVTDVYALGAILYECLTGRPPFKAESAVATLQQMLADDPVPPTRLNPRVPRVPGDNLPEVPGEGLAQAVSIGRGAGRRPAAVRPRGDDRGAARRVAGADRQVGPASADRRSAPGGGAAHARGRHCGGCVVRQRPGAVACRCSKPGPRGQRRSGRRREAPQGPPRPA